jgi:opacity protein-like surface antigen
VGEPHFDAGRVHLDLPRGADNHHDVQEQVGRRRRGAVRPRLDRFLVYDKVAATWANHTFSTATSGVFGTSLSGSATLPGLLWGFGIEYALSQNWTVKAETDFVWYKATDVTLTVGCGALLICAPTVVTSENSVAIYAKMGVNYKF